MEIPQEFDRQFTLWWLSDNNYTELLHHQQRVVSRLVLSYSGVVSLEDMAR